MSKVIIWDDPTTKITSVMRPSKRKTVDDIKYLVPSGVDYEIIEDTTLPDGNFRDSWRKVGSTVKEDLTEAKKLGHDKRRVQRTKEFKPYDKQVALNISSDEVAAAEAERAKIRTKYTTVQTDIDNATDIAGIKTALGI